MKVRAPEFFFNSISKVADNDMIAAATFSGALDELFTLKQK
jgi:hypothetical protein